MKRPRKFWIYVAIGVILLFILILISSIIQLGERLANIHVFVAYGFYALAGLLVYFLILRPVMIILFSPTLSINTTVDCKKKRHGIYKKVAKRIIAHADISEETKKSLSTTMHNKDELRLALDNAYRNEIRKKINKIIQKNAKTVMVSTAISQNGRLDFLTVVAVNLRMVKEIVQICGFRPSYRHLAKLTVNVFLTALIAEGLENLNIADILPQSSMNVIGEIPFLKPILSSVVQGISNALLTLRVGIVTRKYLFSDENDVTKEKIRLGALIEATKYLPLVIADGLSIFPRTVFNMFKRKKSEPLELEEDTLKGSV